MESRNSSPSCAFTFCIEKSYHTEVIAAAETWLDGQPSEFFLSGLQKLEQRAKKCIELFGEYVE